MIDAEIQKKITFSRSQGSAPTSDDRQKTIKVQKKINFHMCATHHHPQSPKKNQLSNSLASPHTQSPKKDRKKINFQTHANHDILRPPRKSKKRSTLLMNSATGRGKVQKKINFLRHTNTTGSRETTKSKKQTKKYKLIIQKRQILSIVERYPVVKRRKYKKNVFYSKRTKITVHACAPPEDPGS